MPEDVALIFAYHFPPENAIGALRPFRFYKYLSRMGYRCHVISAADVTRLPDIDGQYIPDPFVAKTRHGAGWQIERGIRKLLMPGVVGSQWSLHAYRAALRYMAEHPGSRFTIFSTFPPLGTHVAAYWLSRRKHLPWIADFRDPLADNPVYASVSPFTKGLYRKLEKLFVNAADFVIANTDSAQEKLQRSYPRRAEHIRLIWNGFDPEERLQPLPVSDGGRKIVAHVGELYGGRSVSPILHALRRLVDSQKLSSDRFQIHLAGPTVEGSVPDASFVARAAGEGWLKISPERVPQHDALQIVRAADALLLIQPQSALQVPGKLFEYLQIGRPILAFVPPNSPVERILQKSGVPYQCVYSSSPPDEVDRSVLQFFLFSDADRSPNDWFENEFNAQRHAEKVADLIQQAVHRRLRTPALSQVAQD